MRPDLGPDQGLWSTKILDQTKTSARPGPGPASILVWSWSGPGLVLVQTRDQQITTLNAGDPALTVLFLFLVIEGPSPARAFIWDVGVDAPIKTQAINPTPMQRTVNKPNVDGAAALKALGDTNLNIIENLGLVSRSM